MAFGTDLKDFVNAFVAGYNLVPSQQDKDKTQAQIDQAKASTNLTNAQASALPLTTKADLDASAASTTYTKARTAALPLTTQADIASKAASANQANATADYYRAGRPKGGVVNYDWGSDTSGDGGSGAATSTGAVPITPAAAADTSDTSSDDDQSEYAAPPQGASGTPDYRTAAPSQLSSLISSTAAQNGVDPAYALTVADIETGGTYNPAALNPKSGASGLFQFMPSTAAHMGLKDPTDPVSSTATMAKLTAQNGAILQQALGRKPSPGELYLAHQQGPMAASLMLTNPSVPALTALTAAYQKAGAANPQAIATKALQENGGNTQMTAGQFAGKWVNAFQNRYAQVTGQGNSQASAPASGAVPVPLAPLAYSGDAAGAPASINNPDAPADDPTLGAYPAGTAGYNAQLARSGQGNAAVGAIDTAAGPASGPVDPVKGVIKAGMAVLSNRFMPAVSAAVPATGAPAPNVRGYLSGDTRAQQSDVDQIYAKVDPDHKMSDTQRVSAAFAYIAGNTHAPLQAKAAAAADLMQYYRVNFDRYAAIAKVAHGDGNMDAATKAITKAYNNIPDGQSIEAVKQDGGKYQITIKNDTTGEVTQQALLSPSEIGAQIEKVTPGFFDQQVATFAASPTPDKTPLSGTDKQAISDFGKTGTVDQDAYSGMTTQGRAAYDNAVKNSQAQETTVTTKVNNAETRTQFGKDAFDAVNSVIGGDAIKTMNPALQPYYAAAVQKNATALQSAAARLAGTQGGSAQSIGQDLATMLAPAPDPKFAKPGKPIPPEVANPYTIERSGNSATITFANDGHTLVVPMSTMKVLADIKSQAVGAQAADEVSAMSDDKTAQGAAKSLTKTMTTPGMMFGGGALPIGPSSYKPDYSAIMGK